MKEPTYQDQVLDRLDDLMALLTLVHGDAIERTRERLRSDPVTIALLDGCAEDWVSAGTLVEAVRKSTGAGASTIRRRLAELAAMRTLRSRGATKTRAYRARGIV